MTQSFSSASDLGGFSLVSDGDSVVELDTGATANSVFFLGLEPRGRLFEERGRQKISTYPPSARFRLGDCRLGVVRRAADIPAGIAKGAG